MVCLVVTLSRAMALSSFLSSSSLMYISYSSCRWGGTNRLWSGTHRHRYDLVNQRLTVPKTKTRLRLKQTIIFSIILSLERTDTTINRKQIFNRGFTAHFDVNADKLTINELSLLLNYLVTQVSVLFEALHHKVFLPNNVVLEQRVGLHLCVLNLQLVNLAEEAQDLTLLF